MSHVNYNANKVKFKHITEKTRYKIEALYGRGLSAAEIGKEIGKDRRSVEREIEKGLTFAEKQRLDGKGNIPCRCSPTRDRRKGGE